MSNSKTRCFNAFLVSGISLPLEADEAEAYRIAGFEMKRAGINPARLRFHIYRKSIDARKKTQIRLVYSVAARADSPISVDADRLSARKIVPLASDKIEVELGSEPQSYPPLVVGMGPAGLFCALMLAENGYAPVIIDRGDSVSDRVAATERFIKNGSLDVESNVQFGAGGAGTFSDGKLLTRVNDARISYVLKRFCDFGAPEEIMTDAKPHIGTDRLRGVVDNMLCRIEELGGRVIYRCKLEDVTETADRALVARTTKGDIPCSSLVLATGHSARDVYGMLMNKGYAIAPKAFSVGVRVEHRREDIDRALYGDFAGHEKLGAAEYHLSDTKGERGVYTFCMCPGGEVVAGASEEGGVVVNGMSNYSRNGENSNSAVLVSVFGDDYGDTPTGAIEFQRALERRAFALGGADYSAPVSTLGDFLNGKSGSEPSRIMPTYREGRVKVARVDTLFPEYITNTLKRGFLAFDKKLSGFAVSDAVISAVETRTSAPVRILRNDEMTAIGHSLVYPCGEGAGYAGGITSAALDGIKVSLAIMKRFAPIR